VARNNEVKILITGDTKKLGTALAGADAQLGGFQGKVQGWAGKLGVAAAAAGVAIGAGVGLAAVGLFKLGENFDSAYDKIRVGTGATGQALKGLEGDFKQVLKDVPTDFEGASTAIADLNTRLGLTGEPLQELSGQFINLSRITGTEVASNIDNITRVFGDWGISVDQQAESMDKLYRASQASGIGLEELSTSVVQFGAPLRNLGFTFDDSLALLAQFNKTGVNTQTVFAGLKAGVGKLAKSGEDIPTTFRRIVSEITALGPGSEATGKAIELFGQRAGPDLADAIAGGKFEIDGLLDSITNGGDTINQAALDTEDFAEKWQRFKNRVLVGLEPLAMKVFDGVGAAMDKLGPVVERVAAWVQGQAVPALKDFGETAARVVVPAFQKVAGFVTGTLLPGLVKLGSWLSDKRELLIGVGAAIGVGLVAAFVSWATAAASAAAATIAATWPILAIGAAIAGLVAGVVWAYKNWEPFRNVVDAVGRVLRDTVWPAVQRVGKLLAGAFLTAAKAVGGFITKTLWPALQRVGSVVASVVVPALQRLGQFITGTVIPAHEQMFAAIRMVASWLSDTFGPVVSEVGGLIAAVWQRVSTDTVAAWNIITGAVRTAWSVVSAVISAAWTVIGPLVRNGLAAISAVWSAAWSAISAVVPPVWSAIKGVVSGAINVVRGVIRTVTGLISGDWSKVWSGITTALSGYWNAMRSIVTGAVNAVRAIIGSALSAISGVWNSAWNGARSTVSSVFGGIRSTISGAMEGARATVASVLGAIGGLFGGVRGTIARALSGIADAVAAPFRAAGNAIRSAWNSSIGGKGITVPDIPGLPGRGQRYEIPRLHTGIARVPGRAGSEFPAILEAGESVRSRSQENRLQSILSRVEDVDRAARAGGSSRPVESLATITLDLRGAVIASDVDLERIVVRALESAAAKGTRLPRTARAIRTTR